MLFERLRWSFAWFGAILLGGATGYRLIEGWGWLDSMWMVVITLTTIGYGEVHSLSDLGRLFTMGLVLFGIGVGTYTLGQVSQYLLDGEFIAELQARRRRRIMSELNDHVIVIGHGRLGREVTAELIHCGRQVVVIEPHPEAQGVAHHGIEPTLLIEGDGSDEELLERAAIGRAQAIAVVTGNDPTNIFVTLTTRQMNPRLHIVTRVDDVRSVDKALRAGADAVINPYGISGVRMAQGLLHPHAAQLLDQAIGRGNQEFQIEDVQIGDVPSYHGPLGALDIPGRHGILLLAVRSSDGDLRTNLDRHTSLGPGDIAVVVGRPSDVRDFARAAMGLDDRTKR